MVNGLLEIMANVWAFNEICLNRFWNDFESLQINNDIDRFENYGEGVVRLYIHIECVIFALRIN